MATKKIGAKKDSVPTTIQEVAAPVSVPAEGGTCLHCRSLQTGWQGPKCGNPKSAFYKQRVRDADMCEYFDDRQGLKRQNTPVSSSEDGLYTPDIQVLRKEQGDEGIVPPAFDGSANG